MKKSGPHVRDMYSVFIGHIDPDVRKPELFDLFSSCGKVSDLFICDSDKTTYHYGFVRYPDMASAVRAVSELNRWQLHGVPLVVDISKDTSERIAREKKGAKQKLVERRHDRVQDEQPYNVKNAHYVEDMMFMNRLKEACTDLNMNTSQSHDSEVHAINVHKVMEDMERTERQRPPTVWGELAHSDTNLDSIRDRLFERCGQPASGEIEKRKAQEFVTAINSIMSTMNKFIMENSPPGSVAENEGRAQKGTEPEISVVYHDYREAEKAEFTSINESPHFDHQIPVRTVSEREYSSDSMEKSKGGLTDVNLRHQLERKGIGTAQVEQKDGSEVVHSLTSARKVTQQLTSADDSDNIFFAGQDVDYCRSKKEATEMERSSSHDSSLSEESIDGPVDDSGVESDLSVWINQSPVRQRTPQAPSSRGRGRGLKPRLEEVCEVESDSSTQAQPQGKGSGFPVDAEKLQHSDEECDPSDDPLAVKITFKRQRDGHKDDSRQLGTTVPYSDCETDSTVTTKSSCSPMTNVDESVRVGLHQHSPKLRDGDYIQRMSEFSESSEDTVISKSYSNKLLVGNMDSDERNFFVSGEMRRNSKTDETEEVMLISDEKSFDFLEDTRKDVDTNKRDDLFSPIEQKSDGSGDIPKRTNNSEIEENEGSENITLDTRPEKDSENVSPKNILFEIFPNLATSDGTSSAKHTTEKAPVYSLGGCGQNQMLQQSWSREYDAQPPHPSKFSMVDQHTSVSPSFSSFQEQSLRFVSPLVNSTNSYTPKPYIINNPNFRNSYRSDGPRWSEGHHEQHGVRYNQQHPARQEGGYNYGPRWSQGHHERHDVRYGNSQYMPRQEGGYSCGPRGSQRHQDRHNVRYGNPQHPTRQEGGYHTRSMSSCSRLPETNASHSGSSERKKMGKSTSDSVLLGKQKGGDPYNKAGNPEFSLANYMITVGRGRGCGVP